MSSTFKGKTDAEVSGEVDRLREERRAFAVEHQNRLRDDGHAAVDRVIAEARETFERVCGGCEPSELVGGLSLETVRMGGRGELELGALWTVGYSSDYAAARHALVDQVEGWSEHTRAAFEKQLAKLDGEIADREKELARRGIERRKGELEQELAAIEGRVAS